MIGVNPDTEGKDQRFLQWVRDPATTRGMLIMARERSNWEWHYRLLTRELERREGVRKCFAQT